MSHTPTPWTNKDEYGREKLWVWAGGALEEHRRVGAPVANCEQFDAAEEDEANAAFIVEACNAYEKHVQQIQHLDSAVRAQASTITRLNKENEDLHRTLGIIHEERDSLLREAVAKARDKKAAALCEEGK